MFAIVNCHFMLQWPPPPPPPPDDVWQMCHSHTTLMNSWVNQLLFVGSFMKPFKTIKSFETPTCFVGVPQYTHAPQLFSLKFNDSSLYILYNNTPNPILSVTITRCQCVPEYFEILHRIDGLTDLSTSLKRSLKKKKKKIELMSVLYNDVQMDQ